MPFKKMEITDKFLSFEARFALERIQEVRVNLEKDLVNYAQKLNPNRLFGEEYSELYLSKDVANKKLNNTIYKLEVMDTLDSFLVFKNSGIKFYENKYNLNKEPCVESILKTFISDALHKSDLSEVHEFIEELKELKILYERFLTIRDE